MHKKLPIAGLLVSILTLALSATASAHVVVTPAEAATASSQVFTVNVPNEKDTPTISVKLVVPGGLQSVSPYQKPGWKISIEKDGAGQTAAVKSITWSGGSIGVGLRDGFDFKAKVPASPAQLHWKAYQTYADGTVVSWDQASKGGQEGGSSGPFSVTKVVAQTAQDAALQKAGQAAADAKAAANRSFSMAVAGLAVGLIGIFLATRKK